MREWTPELIDAWRKEQKESAKIRKAYYDSIKEKGRPYGVKGSKKGYSSTGLKRKQYLVALLGGSCIRCGFNESIYALEFDHKDHNKKTLPIEESLNDCQLLCVNCHRIKTYEPGIFFRQETIP